MEFEKLTRLKRYATLIGRAKMLVGEIANYHDDGENS